MHGDFLVTANTEGSDGVAGLRVNGLLAGKLFQHLEQRGKSCFVIASFNLTFDSSYLGSSGQSITGFSHTDVQAEFADSKITHNVLCFVLRRPSSWSSGGFSLKQENKTKLFQRVCESEISGFHMNFVVYREALALST